MHFEVASRAFVIYNSRHLDDSGYKREDVKKTSPQSTSHERLEFLRCTGILIGLHIILIAKAEGASGKNEHLLKKPTSKFW